MLSRYSSKYIYQALLITKKNLLRGFFLAPPGRRGGRTTDDDGRKDRQNKSYQKVQNQLLHLLCERKNPTNYQLCQQVLLDKLFFIDNQYYTNLTPVKTAVKTQQISSIATHFCQISCKMSDLKINKTEKPFSLQGCAKYDKDFLTIYTHIDSDITLT